MGVSIEFISLLDEGGVEVFSYPPQNQLDMVGSALVATIEMINRKNMGLLEKIHLEDLIIYLKKLNGNATLIIAFKNPNNKSNNGYNFEKRIKWFIRYLT